jgi:hypothetical protein
VAAVFYFVVGCFLLYQYRFFLLVLYDSELLIKILAIKKKCFRSQKLHVFSVSYTEFGFYIMFSVAVWLCFLLVAAVWFFVSVFLFPCSAFSLLL